MIRILRGLITLFGLSVIRSYFGYAQALDNSLLILVVAILCAFIPFSASSLLLIVYFLINLYSLSGRVAGFTLALFIASYILCGFYRSRHVHNIVYFPLCYQMQFPFALPLISGLTGSLNEATSVVCGSVIAFYLSVIRRNSSLFLEKNGRTSVTDLIVRNMFYNPMFYFFMLAMLAMFLVVYLIRERAIGHAWNVAVISGTLSEFILMLIGYFATGNAGRIPQLIFWNIVVMLVGIVTGALVKGMDYTHIEKVQFEDDEYYYYVTAVPKTRMTEESKEVRNITAQGGRRRRNARKRRSSSTGRSHPAENEMASDRGDQKSSDILSDRTVVNMAADHTASEEADPTQAGKEDIR